MVKEASHEEIVARAIKNAKDSFDDTFEAEGLDPAFWSMDVVISWMDEDFKDILRQTKDIDYQKKPYRIHRNVSDRQEQW